MPTLEGNLTALYLSLKSDHEDLRCCLKAKKNQLKFINAPFKSNKETSNLAKAIAHTHHLFHQALGQIAEDFNHYKNYLIRSGKGYFVDESAFFVARDHITSWNQNIRPFVKLLDKDRFQKFENFLKKIFLKNNSSNVSNSSDIKSFFIPSLAFDLAEIQNVIDLEGRTFGPLPLSIIKKIIKLKPLSVSENKDLKKWIDKVNASSISLKDLHSAFKYLGKIYGNDLDTDTYRLELTLEELSLKILQQEDKKHFNWMQSLTPGFKVILKDREVTLGEEIHNKSKRLIKSRVFNIKEDDHLVAIINANRLKLALKDLKLRQQTMCFDLKPALILEFSKDQKIALMEKLTAVDHIKWMSVEENLREEDKKILVPISQFLTKLIKENKTPKNFTTNYLMLDKTHELKVLKPDDLSGFDFTAIENFIFNIAAGNLSVFKYLMTTSKMSKHLIANFYEDLLKTSLTKETVTVEDLSAIHLISDPKVVDQAKIFIQKMRELKTHICNKLFELNLDHGYQFIENKVNEALIKQHLSYNCCGSIWPTLASDVINSY